MMEAGQVDGFRHFDGLPRKLVLVDEHPNLVSLMPAYPGDIQSFFEDVNFYAPGHDIAAVLRRVVARMNDMAASSGQRFEVADNLLDPDDMLSFLMLKPADLGRFINPTLTAEPRKARLVVLEGLRDFLVAASQGGCLRAPLQRHLPAPQGLLGCLCGAHRTTREGNRQGAFGPPADW